MKRGLMVDVQDHLSAKLRERGGALLGQGERLRARNGWKRDLAGRANGTINPWYQCDVYDEMLDYALNFTFPWCKFPFHPIPFTL